MRIWCCGCGEDVDARLTDGREIYPRRSDLAALPFWKCDTCLNYVGCHHKTSARTRPLGNIPTPELRKARGHIHALIDPLWRTKRIERNALYELMTKRLGWKYHTADLRTIEAAREAYKVGVMIKNELQ